jgi:predicted permease
LSGLAAYANWSASLAGDGVTERLQGARMSANAFDVLRVTPSAGRLLLESDDHADAPNVVVLSHPLWQRRFGGAPDAVGRKVRINGDSFVVVGVLPEHFPLPLRGLDVVTPLVPDRDPLRHLRNSVNFLLLFGRLNPGTDAREAQSELTAICRTLRLQFPVEYARKDSVRVTALHDAIVGSYRQSMLLLLAAVVVVLATALANLVSLALDRANRRRTELWMRVAIGASRLHLSRQLSVEALLLAVAGSGLGWLVAAHAVDGAVRWAPPSIPRLGEVRLDGAVTLFVTAATALVSVLLTLAPLSTVARGGPPARGASGDRRSHRVRSAMVVSELAAALVVLVATIVLVQNLLRLREAHLGFDPEAVFQARVSIPAVYRSPEDVSRFYERLSDRLAASPGVTHVGAISVAPLSGLLATVPFSVAGEASARSERPSANLRVISPGYPSVVGTRLLDGRSLSEADRPATPPVALVSAALADRFFAGGAVGERLFIDDNNEGPRPVEIVGVVENVSQMALDLPPAFDVYIPLRQIHPDEVPLLRNNQFWVVKTDGDPESFRDTFVRHLRAIDPDAAVSGTGAMRRLVDAWLAPRRFHLGLFSAFATTAVLLAVLGLYGLTSYAVSQRTTEIGLRMAVGATQRDAQRMVLRQAVGLGATGAAVGLGLAVAGRPLVSSMVQDVSIHPGVLVAAASFLMGVVLLAAWLPARRAARIEPTLALKVQ